MTSAAPPFMDKTREVVKRVKKFGFVTALKHKDGRIREAAVDALGKIRDARAVEPLCAALTDNDASVRSFAAKALAYIGDARAFDNIFIERLWRNVKYEDLYINEYLNAPALETGLRNYFALYNYERPHQSLDYRTPADVHFSAPAVQL